MSQTFVAAAGSRTYFGGAGINTFDYSAAPGSVVFDLIHNYAQNGFGGIDNVYNIQVVIGSTHGTTFTGGSGNETFVVKGGNNTISGSLSTLVEIPTLTLNARPFSMVNGPDGSIWFTEFNTDAIARLSFGSPSTGITLTEFPTPHNPNAPGNTGDIAFDASGNMWFTEIANNKIGVMSQTGVLLHEYDTSSIAPGSLTHRIVAGPDGNMWFAEAGTGNIGKITPAGVVTEYPLATNSQPFDITVGPDGNLWYTDNVSNKIGVITPAGVINEYAIPGPFTFDPTTGHGNPVGIIAGPDGALWFAEDSKNMIGRITTGGQLTEFAIPTADSGPQEIVVGPDGALWFTEQQANKIGRITTDGHFTEFPINSTISANPFPFDLLFGPDGNLWFSELTGRAIGRMTTATVLTVDYSGAPQGVIVNLATGSATNGFGGTDTLSDVHSVIGSLTGHSTLIGGSNGDVLVGQGSSNILDGGAGSDQLTGGAGDDRFVFGTAALTDANSAIFDEITDYGLAKGDQIDLSAILSATYNHGSGEPAASLVKLVADPSGSFSNLQVDTDGAGGAANWLTIAKIDGLHPGGGVKVILDTPQVVTGVNNFGTVAGGWTDQNHYPREVADVNGDGKADIVGFGAGGVNVSLATSDGHFAAPTDQIGNFGVAAGGWIDQNHYPRELADVNGDGMADIVGFGAGGVSVSLATGDGHFAAPTDQIGNFGVAAGGWIDQNHYPRELADVNGDGMADIVGFGAGGVSVSLATGNGHFAAPTDQIGNFGVAAGGWIDQNQYPRELADVNGDGMADIVGFGAGGVSVSLATGNGHFAAPTDQIGNFGVAAGGWSNQDQYPRLLADVNGDGMADIVGFSAGGVNVSLATGNGHFAAPTFEQSAFGVVAGGWSSENQFPRNLGDVDGDGMADIVGFGANGVQVAHVLESTFFLV